MTRRLLQASRTCQKESPKSIDQTECLLQRVSTDKCLREYASNIRLKEHADTSKDWIDQFVFDFGTGRRVGQIIRHHEVLVPHRHRTLRRVPGAASRSALRFGRRQLLRNWGFALPSACSFGLVFFAGENGIIWHAGDHCFVAHVFLRESGFMYRLFVVVGVVVRLDSRDSTPQGPWSFFWPQSRLCQRCHAASPVASSAQTETQEASAASTGASDSPRGRLISPLSSAKQSLRFIVLLPTGKKIDRLTFGDRRQRYTRHISFLPPSRSGFDASALLVPGWL